MASRQMHRRAAGVRVARHVAITLAAAALLGSLIGGPTEALARGAAVHIVKPRRATRISYPKVPTRKLSIIGGAAVAPGSAPWAAFVYYWDQATQSGFQCTGTVVSPTLILTAAHCAEDLAARAAYDASDYSIVTGVSDISQRTPDQVQGVSQVIVNPDFDPSTLSGDAALLRLTRPTPAPSISLATDADTGLVAAGATATIVGWGLMEGTDSTGPDALQSAPTYVLKDSWCGQWLHPAVDSATMICAIDWPSGATGTCNGDSGGPLLGRRQDGTWVEIGITSWGIVGCSTDYPDVFTRVSAISPWTTAWITTGGPPLSGPLAAPPTMPGAVVNPVVPSASTPIVMPAPTPIVSPPPSLPKSVARARGLSLGATPRRARHAPFRFRFHGKLRLPSAVRRVEGCRGTILIAVRHGATYMARRRVKLSRACSYTLPLTFSVRRLGRHGTLRVSAAFAGNARVLPRKSKPLSVRFG